MNAPAGQCFSIKSAIISALCAGLLFVESLDSAAAQTPVPANAGELNAQYGWLIEPGAVGPDIPPIGRSLFDFLFAADGADNKAYDIPFPFSALIAKIEQDLDLSEARTGIEKVLIPLGRSLQRPAALNEFFVFPRAVAAVVKGPKFESGKAGVLLKDRLYIAYHEKSKVLEIISYNEAAARFEFQLVKHYKKATQPEVYYARRAICTACHQNQAPIFSRPAWQETSANPMISAYLKATGKTYYGFSSQHGVDIPNAIDESSDRANLLSLAQWVWQQGCRANTMQVAARCRAGLLSAMLQYRLGNQRGFNQAPKAFQEFVLPVLKRNWALNWPRGLALSNPDIPNRDPFLRQMRSKAIDPDSTEFMHVEAAFEPLNTRLPLEVWRELSPARIAIIIKSLAGFLAESDIIRLDQQLKARFQISSSPLLKRYRSACVLRARNKSNKVRRINFDCAMPKDSDLGFAVKGKVYVRDATVDRGEVSDLQLKDMQVNAGYFISAQAGIPYSNSLKLIDRHAQSRLNDGRRIASFNLDWRVPEPNTGEYSASAVLTVVDDLQPLGLAIDEMLVLTLSGQSDVLSSLPFQRTPIIKLLFEQLEIAPLEWCCTDIASLAPPQTEMLASAAGQAKVPAGVPGDFFKYCAQCHLTREQFPPNFLSSDSKGVEARIAQCAERLYYRLGMWTVDQYQRPKTVMPPLLFLDRVGSSSAHWRDGRSLDGLIKYLEQVLGAQTGAAPRLADYLNRDYEQLRTCLK